MKFFSNLFDINKREIDRLAKIVEKINVQEKNVKKLKDSDFAKQTQKLRKRALDGQKPEELAVEALALAREAAVRTLHMRPYDVQIMASLALSEGKIVEQKTGEGKTLSAFSALYLHALYQKGVHLVTVNDFLSRLGAGWNAPAFTLLGMSVGVVGQEGKSYIYDTKFSDSTQDDERLVHLKPVSRREVYAADITYGTNNEFGFDYLRDNMVSSLDEMVQRGHYFAIVDEVDSILIDEARTPLIISAPDSQPTEKYYKFAQLVQKLTPETDYEIDEKLRTATLTEEGIEHVEKILNVTNLYEKDFDTIHHIENALRARSLQLKDREYIVKDGEVTIVDEFTGRLMPGRRWSDGLHQAVEAKEGVTIKQESKTLATISFQNYFRMYEKLSGMTGTAATEADEFHKIYKLDVVAIPTHRDNIRKDHADAIYKNTTAKLNAIVEEIKSRHEKDQPILIGTTSIEKNEIIGSFLKKEKIPFNLLNAKNHQEEALIIANAGKPGAVTVATNMAGRGVDIVLGGALPENPKSKEYKAWESQHKKVTDAGGLHVIGTERHESRRIDNQLRGRAGRQGDPGSTQFYLSLEDDLMRIFGGDQISSLMTRLKIPEDQPIQNPLVGRAIASAQTKVEGFHFDARKRVVEYDDVANQQRHIVYSLRRKVLESSDLKKEVSDRLQKYLAHTIEIGWSEGTPDWERLFVGFMEIVPFDDASSHTFKQKLEDHTSREDLEKFLNKTLDEAYKLRETQVGEEIMRQIEKYAYLGSIDKLWMEHIDSIDRLREGIGLRAYGRDPLVEFKQEAYGMFERLMDSIDQELAHRIFRMGVMSAPPSEIPLDKIQTNIDKSDQTGLSPSSPKPQKTTLGRNDLCWCGSGKKWKHCHYPKTS
jgi:preprotein translocase subunit SecA